MIHNSTRSPRRRIAVIQLQGTDQASSMVRVQPVNIPGLLTYAPPPPDAPKPVAPPAVDWTKVLPWIAAASGVITLLTVLERFGRKS